MANKTPADQTQAPKIDAETKSATSNTSLYNGPDVTCAQLFVVVEKAVAQYKTLEARLAAAEGDRDKAISAWLESSDDAEAKDLRDQIAALQSRLQALAEEKVVSETLSDEDKAKLVAEKDALKGTIKSGRDAIDNVNKTLRTDFEGVNAALEALGDPTRSNRGRPVGSTGSKLPRVSASLEVKYPDGTTKNFDTMSAAATALDVEVKDMQLAFAKSAGVKHEDIKTVDKSITFEFAVGDKTYTIVTTPKARAPRGSKTA